MTSTIETRPRKLASRHYCPNRDATGLSSFHTAGNGRPRGLGRCRYCASTLTTVTGLWGVFVHRGDGRYYLDAALSTHVSEPAADRACARAYDVARAEHGYGAPETCVVVRWIHADND